MATKRKTAADAKKRTGPAMSGVDTRERIRDLTVHALRDRDVSRGDVAALMHQVLETAADTVDGAMPASRDSVLRQVSEGLGDAFAALARAGANTAEGARQRGRAIAEQVMPAMTKQIQAANEEYLRAISSFAKRTSAELGEELNTFVKRARRTGGQVGESARQTARAVDGRLMELTGEAAQAGMSVARRAASEIAMAASGLLEGLGEAVRPKKAGAAAKAAKAGGKASRKTVKAAAKSVSKRGATSKRKVKRAAVRRK